jgi:hypothetical protein
MKNIIIAAIITLLFALVAIAASPLPGVDGNRGNVTDFAPNGSKDGVTTVNGVTVDMRNDAKWAFYAMSTCKFRTMSTTTKSGRTRRLPAGSHVIRGVNPKSPYINFTGCKSGEYQRQ